MIYICIVVAALVIIWYIWRGDSQPTPTQYDLAAKMFGNNQPEHATITFDLEEECARIEALIQCNEASHSDIHQQIEDGTYQGPMPERRSDGGWTSIFDDLRILPVAGINHRTGINRYKGRNTCALVPEPTNEFDPEAIKVVAEDGHHLGYVRRDHTEMVRSWAAGVFPMYCVCRIEEHDDDDDNRFFTGYLYIKLKR